LKSVRIRKTYHKTTVYIHGGRKISQSHQVS